MECFFLHSQYVSNANSQALVWAISIISIYTDSLHNTRTSFSRISQKISSFRKVSHFFHENTRDSTFAWTFHCTAEEESQQNQVKWDQKICARENRVEWKISIFFMQRIFTKINLNFSHIFHCRHIVNLQNELLILSLSCNACTGHVHQIFFSKKNRACKIFENSHLPPTGSLSSILIITALSYFVYLWTLNEIFFTTFSSGLERRLEASASLLIGIFTVDSFFLIDHRLCARALFFCLTFERPSHDVADRESSKNLLFSLFFIIRMWKVVTLWSTRRTVRSRESFFFTNLLYDFPQFPWHRFQPPKKKTACPSVCVWFASLLTVLIINFALAPSPLLWRVWSKDETNREHHREIEWRAERVCFDSPTLLATLHNSINRMPKWIRIFSLAPLHFLSRTYTIYLHFWSTKNVAIFLMLGSHRATRRIALFVLISMSCSYMCCELQLFAHDLETLFAWKFPFN